MVVATSLASRSVAGNRDVAPPKAASPNEMLQFFIRHSFILISSLPLPAAFFSASQLPRFLAGGFTALKRD